MAVRTVKQPRAKTRSRALATTNRFVLWVLVPSIVWYVIFQGAPMLYALYLSFFRWNFLDPPKFVGLDNYIHSLTADRLFYTSLQNTISYTFYTVVIGGLIAFIFAYLINARKRSAPVFRTIYFLPVVCSMAAIAVLWRWIYQPRFGILNSFLDLVGIDQQMWLESPDTAMVSVIIASIWKGLGFTMVIFLAGLQGIPRTLYEAAEVDGAGRLQMVRHITVPLLRPTTVFVLVTGVINGLQAFTEMHVLTGGTGGPLDSARTLVFHLYERSFDFFQMGRAAAIAFLLFLVIIVLTIVMLKFTDREVQY